MNELKLFNFFLAILAFFRWNL